MKKKWIILIVCLIFLGVFIQSYMKFQTEKKPRVVVVLKENTIQYWKIVKAGAEKAFKTYGVDGVVLAPQHTYPYEKQISILNNVLMEKPDILIVSPSVPSKTIPVLEEYKNNNIPVILVDTEADWPDQTSFIGTNNITLGRKAGELLASTLQPGNKVAIISWSSDNTAGSVGYDRLKGAEASLKVAGIKTVIEKVVYDKSFKSTMRKVIKQNPDLKGIFTADDLMALDTLEVLEENGFKIPVIGADGIMDMVEHIEYGTIKSTVAQNPYDMGYKSVETALKVLNGEQVEKNIDSGVDIITEENAKNKLAFLQKILINQ